MILASKKDNGGNDVGEVRDELAIEVCKAEERTDAFD